MKSVLMDFFDRHVLDAMLPMDVTVLCDLVEHLCGSVVLVRATVMHNMALPLSWLRALFPKFKHDPKLNRADVNPMLDKLVKTLQQFIKSLSMGVENQTSEFEQCF